MPTTALAVLLALLTAVWSTTALAASKVSGLRFGVTPEQTRIVIDIDKPVEFTHFLLADPYRIVVDLPEINWKLNNGGGAGEGQGLVGQYRYGLFRPGTSRLVLDLKGSAIVARAFHLEPTGGHGHRIVLDLTPVDRADFLAFVKAPVVRDRPTVSPTAPMGLAKRHDNVRKVVVIDPGHGGVDPGNTASRKVWEKTVVLAVSRLIRDELKKTGRYDVYMTRDRDIFIELRDRVQIGRDRGADLFISVHADSIKDKNIRGASVYTLSEKASDRHAAALANRENKADLIAGINLQGESQEVTNILIDLARRETMNYSARFAALLVPELSNRVVLLRNAHRFANLAVLKAPDVPSVLLETGYLSNAQDTSFLNSSRGQKRLAVSVARAVESYFSALVAQQF